jgi:signal transduction histidine kinase
VGIEQKDLPKVFEPFFTTKKEIGNGLGLWLVKQFVEGMGGTITVESRAAFKDKGTTFSIFIPYENNCLQKLHGATELGTPKAC